MITWLHHHLEAAATLIAYALLRLVGLRASSAFGGWVARTLGPHTRVHQVARRNLTMALPELSEAEVQHFLNGMWDNLGRVFGEYPYLRSPALLDQVEVVGWHHVAEAITRSTAEQKPILFISGHLGNWEILPIISAAHGLPLHLLYRPANNPVVDCLVAWLRRPHSLGLHPKGSHTARHILAAMKRGEPVAMLVDQKANDGVAIPFFGHDAMTTTAVAQLIAKCNAIVIPTYCRRIRGTAFIIEAYEPLQVPAIAAGEDQKHAIMCAIHHQLEAWIRDDPAQWFWVHKRWPHSKLPQSEKHRA